MIFFDTSEHQIREKRSFELPPLGDQWKIIFDFKPTEFVQDEMTLLVCHIGRRSNIFWLAIGSPNILLHCCGNPADYLAGNHATIKSNELPVVGEWTRVEISHEKEEDKYFLYLIVGGKELGERDVTFAELRGASRGTDLCIGEDDAGFIQPGLIRRLVALRK